MDTLFTPVPPAELAALGVVVVGFEITEVTPAAPVFSECGCNGHGVAVAIEDESVTCECDPFWDGPTCTQCTAIGGCELHLSGRFPQELRQAVFEQGAQILAAAPVVTSPDLAAISIQVVLGVAGAARTVVVGTPTFMRVDEVTLDGAPFPQTTMTMDVAAVLKSSVPIGGTLSFARYGDHLRVAASQRIPAAVGRTGLFVLDTRCGQACYHRLVSADGYADIDDQGRVVLAGVVVEQAQLLAAIDALPQVTP